MDLVLDVTSSASRSGGPCWTVGKKSQGSIGVSEDDFSYRRDGFQSSPGVEEGSSRERERDDFGEAELIVLSTVELDLFRGRVEDRSGLAEERG